MTIYLMSPKEKKIVKLDEARVASITEYDEFFNPTHSITYLESPISEEASKMINSGLYVDLDETKLTKFRQLTVELLKHKYLYYVKNRPQITDYEYDMKERDWIKLGTDLGIDMEIYPNWVDFDSKHPLAAEATKGI